jgi:hypothetical protein
MGAYSELDIEMRYGSGPQEGDDAFFEDGDSCGAVEPVGAEDVDQQADAALVEPVQAAEPSQPDAEAADQGDSKPAADEAADEDAKRKAHEEAEAKRKAEWEAEQKKKKADELLQIAKVDAMTDDEVLAASTLRVSADTEKLTRRQMMECVMEHIQTKCLENPAFARKVMQPRKNMIRCHQYINRKAWEYVQDEMKAKGITPSRETPAYSCDIPPGVCYQWAEDYFNDPDAKEDHVDEEKFVPKPYRGTSAATTRKSGKGKGKSDKKDSEKGAAKKDTKPAEPKKQDGDDQISFGGFVMPEGKAG